MASNPWFRLYGMEMFADPKLRPLKVEYRLLWVAVLTAAGASPEPGVLLVTESQPVTERDLADLANMHWRTVRTGMDVLVDVGVVELDLDRGSWFVPKWHERQFSSDRSTERVRRHRTRGSEGAHS